jgi:ABC-type multidrug transport system fused ATPase/permease subunit
MSAASAGFILAFAGTISANASSLMVLIRNFELAAVSLERTSEYRHLEKEDPNQHLDGQHVNPSLEEYRNWPSTGKLEVRNLSARYGPDMPDILHQISFSVESGERVGICGATGGGKSTLVKAFFSFVDISNGHILIDGRGEFVF